MAERSTSKSIEKLKQKLEEINITEVEYKKYNKQSA